MALITLSERGEELATGQAGKGEAQQHFCQGPVIRQAVCWVVLAIYISFFPFSHPRPVYIRATAESNGASLSPSP